MNYFILGTIYTLLLSVKVIAPALSTVAMALMTMINISIYLFKKRYSDFALMSSFLMPGEVFPAVSLLIGLFLRIKKKAFTATIKTKKISFFLFMIMIISSIISALVYDTIINLVFYLIYLTIIAFTIVMSDETISPSMIVASMKKFVVIEFLITIMIIVRYRIVTPGDEFCGSMSSAHWLGNWLIVALMLLCFHDESTNRIKLSVRNIQKNCIYIILILVMLYLADAKSLLIALAIGTIGYYFFEHRSNFNYSFMWYTITFCISLFALFGVLYSETIKEFVLQKNHLLYTYLYQSGWNGKFEFIRGTLLEELPGIHLFTGFGLGQYGSRIANMFAYNVMWRADNGINNIVAAFFKPHYIPQYAKYIGFYNADFVSQIGWRSAVMSYPFNSVTAMIAETGLVGILFFSYVFNNYIKESECKILGFYFLVACFFDLYFDNFPCVALLILVMLNTKVRRKEINNG